MELKRRPFVKAICALALLLAGCRHDPESERVKSAQAYLSHRADISPVYRAAINRGEILLGMAPDEAAAAGGANIFIIERDKTVWPNEGTDPWDVLGAQRLRPDNSKITLRFCNKTQFGTDQPVSFAVQFVRGRAVQIEREQTK